MTHKVIGNMMDKPPRIAKRRLVLLGLGHTNAHILRMWKMHAFHDTQLTCIGNFGIATYSGMLPAVLAGQIPPEEMQIDLVRLCASVGARLITEPVVGLDPQQRQVLFAERPPIPFDALSIGIGSAPTDKGLGEGGGGEGETEAATSPVVRIKPMQTFLERLAAATENSGESQRLRVVVVGGGVAGLEISFCLPNYVRQQLDRDCDVTIVNRSVELASDMAQGARRRLTKELKRRGVAVRAGSPVVNVRPKGTTGVEPSPAELELANGEAVKADLVIWATGAAPPPLLGNLGLPLADDGFLEVDECLQTTAPGNLPIFAVGDTATVANQPLPKSGVYAVRQGPVLWDNLRRALYGQRLRPFQPQRTFMRLINLGDGRAVGQWHGISFSGFWAMSWKQWIDQRFMEKFVPEEMPASAESMQCRGCGCKFGGEALEQSLTLARLAQRTSNAGDSRESQWLGGLDDAAAVGVVDSGSESSLYASTDFFSLPFEDAYLSGRIAALHAASDLTAMGAQPLQALANVVIPEGAEAGQQQFLSDFLQGARRELCSMGAELVGGHTTVGPRAEAGFTVIGALHHEPLQKRGLQAGDVLMLTKPLGIGALLAAHFRAHCHADHYRQLVAAMLTPQHPWAEVAAHCGLRAATDVTGFGLAGHLLEMLDASQSGAVLKLESVPALPGALETIEDGIQSSLAPSNSRWMSRATLPDRADDAKLALLSDPQTCGGLLLAVPARQQEAFQQAAAAAGLPTAIAIGEAVPREAGEPPLRII